MLRSEVICLLHSLLGPSNVVPFFFVFWLGLFGIELKGAPLEGPGVDLQDPVVGHFHVLRAFKEPGQSP